MNIIIPNKSPKEGVRLSTLNDPSLQAATWKNVIRHDPKLAIHIRVCMRTMRLAGLIPSWENFMQTPYFYQMTGILDKEELQKYRAWWETIYEISEGKDLPRGIAMFMLAIICRETLRRVYAKEMPIRPERYGLTEEKADQIKEAVLLRYEGLTRF